jgi:hypothetical protein
VAAVRLGETGGLVEGDGISDSGRGDEVSLSTNLVNAIFGRSSF